MTKILLIILVIAGVQGQFEEYTEAKEGYGSDIEKKVVNVIENVCILDDNCFKSIVSLNNYCCTFQCCNIISYVFRNE
jgi:hypothetical protein